MTSLFSPSEAPEVHSPAPDSGSLEVAEFVVLNHDALSVMTDTAIQTYLIQCAIRCNEAAKRGDINGVDTYWHAETEALLEMRNRADFNQGVMR